MLIHSYFIPTHLIIIIMMHSLSLINSSVSLSTHRSYNSAWKEWSSLKAEYPLLGDVLKIIRLNAHKGTGYAKNVGFDKVPYQFF
jgi:hypothetical protein